MKFWQSQTVLNVGNIEDLVKTATCFSVTAWCSQHRRLTEEVCTSWICVWRGMCWVCQASETPRRCNTAKVYICDKTHHWKGKFRLSQKYFSPSDKKSWNAIYEYLFLSICIDVCLSVCPSPPPELSSRLISCSQIFAVHYFYWSCTTTLTTVLGKGKTWVFILSIKKLPSTKPYVLSPDYRYFEWLSICIVIRIL